MPIWIGENEFTTKVAIPPSWSRYELILVACTQSTHFLGLYVIGVNQVVVNIYKVFDNNDLTAVRDQIDTDQVTFTFDISNIYSIGMVIGPRNYLL